MQQMTRSTLITLFVLVVVLVLSTITMVQAQTALQGNYSLNLTRLCPDGELMLTGTLHFNGDGSGTFAGNQASTAVTCSVTYTVNADGTMSQQFSNCSVPSVNEVVLEGVLTPDGLLLTDAAEEVGCKDGGVAMFSQ